MRPYLLSVETQPFTLVIGGREGKGREKRARGGREEGERKGGRKREEEKDTGKERGRGREREKTMKYTLLLEVLEKP